MRVAGIYDGKVRLEENAGRSQLAGWLERGPEHLWLDLTAPTTDDLRFLQDRFQLHPLALEECDHSGVRPKIEEFEDHLYIVFHGLNHNPGQELLSTVEFKIFLRRGLLITLHDQPSTSVSGAFARLQKSPGNLPRLGVDTILQQILDLAVDHYFPLLDQLEDRVESLEEAIFAEPRSGLLQEILGLQRQLLQLGRLLNPQLEILAALASGRFQEVDAQDLPYFRDVAEHVQRISDRVHICREMVAGALQCHLSQSSNRMNAAMKSLAVLATLLLPATFITSLLGMNLEHIPGKQALTTFPAVTLLSVLSGLFILGALRRLRLL